MAAYVIIGAFAALGCMGTLWVLWQLLTPGRKNGWILLRHCDRHLWKCCLGLREAGLLGCRIAVWDEDICPQERQRLENAGIEIWNAARIRAWLEIGAKEYGTGAGDPPGCHQCGGVSEL